MAGTHLPPLVIFSTLVFFASAQQLLSQQTSVLQQLRKLLEYPKQLDSWNDNKDLCSSPSSQSISVSCEDGDVTELKIIGDKLAKPTKSNAYSIPDKTLTLTPLFSIDSFVTTLSRLPSLKVIILVSLGIWGPLPDKIHRLLQLQVLDLSSNFFYGAIPPKLSTLSRLQTLTLDSNFFNGTVPDLFDSLANLTVLSLQSNRLQGPLPSSIGRAKSLTELSFSSNEISGPIPDLSGLEDLAVLNMMDNNLDSELPLLPESLVTILLSRNSFTGEIPLQFATLDRLQHLDLSFNLLQGVIPPQIFDLSNISYLNLASNILSGSFPSSLACSSQLGFVDISDNRLTGGLPSCLSSNSSKRVVKLSWNCLISVDPKLQHEAAYCKEVHLETKRTKLRETGLLIMVIGGVAFITFVLLLLVLYMYKKNIKKASAEQSLLSKTSADNSASGLSSELLANARYISHAMKLEMYVLPSYKVFSLEELKDSTRNFHQSSFIGEGSIGKLYKGQLENGSYVAIRCILLHKKYSIRNLKLRLDLLSKLRHPHLVCLLGHCIDGSPDDSGINCVFLIYEYASKGDLRTRLSDSNLRVSFKWTERLAIVIGVAKAVHFLHTGIVPAILINHLKTQNILFDENYVAKVSDYGLSIITQEIEKGEAKAEGHKPAQNQFTAREVLKTEDDVYALGLILLEVLVGSTVSEKEASLILSSSNHEQREHLLDSIVVSTSTQESLNIVISITNKCLAPYASSLTRPSIEDVLWNLQYAAQVQAAAFPTDHVWED